MTCGSFNPSFSLRRQRSQQVPQIHAALLGNSLNPIHAPFPEPKRGSVIRVAILGQRPTVLVSNTVAGALLKDEAPPLAILNASHSRVLSKTARARRKSPQRIGCAIMDSPSICKPSVMM